MHLKQLFSLFLLLGSVVAEGCNGKVVLCDRKYSDVSQIGTHDSAFVGDLPTQNQGLSVTEQLNSGIRMLQAQTHDFLNDIYVCHTSCWLENSGKLVDYLKTIATWMDANPNEVVTLLLTNGDNVSVTKFASRMQSAGLAKYAFAPDRKLELADWPTLQQLINVNARLVMFMDYHADTGKVPYILDEFTYFFETPYDVTTPDFPSCELDRPGGSNGDGLMYIVNHFLDVKLFDDVLVPDRFHAPRTNAATGAGSIGAQNDVCKSRWGRKPTIVLVDYFETGNVFVAEDAMNGL